MVETFVNDDYKGEYGFDVFENPELKENYKSIMLGNNRYYPHYISIMENQTNILKLKFKFNVNMLTPKCHFKFCNGQKKVIKSLPVVSYDYLRTNNTKEIDIPTNLINNNDSILIVDENKNIVGQFYTKKYSNSEIMYKNIVFVKCYSNLDELDSLNKIDIDQVLYFLNNNSYNQCGIQFNKCTVKMLLLDEKYNRNEVSQSSFYKYLVKNHNYTCFDTLFVYLTMKKYFANNNGEVAGRSSFDKNERNTILLFSKAYEDLNLVLVHEIGHAFTLKHPFDESSINAKNTKNIMDYSNTRLYFFKEQYNHIRENF